MVPKGWQRQYLDALLRGRKNRIAQYETADYLNAVLDEPANGVQELLLHRTIAQLTTVQEAIQLLDLLEESPWHDYKPRILARIADTEKVLAQRADLAQRFETIRQQTGYTTYSIKDWHLIGDGTNLRFPDSPVWAARTTAIQHILPETDLERLNLDHIAAVLEHFATKDIRIFRLGILTFAEPERQWAQQLHQVLATPFFEIGAKHPQHNAFAVTSPSALWTPHWKINPKPRQEQRWNIVETHTGQQLTGTGSETIFNQISILLAVTGLLREGINLTPIDQQLVHALSPSQPIWGFGRREFSADRTAYQAHDIRSLALAFLENLPNTTRVSMFRSRLAMQLVPQAWRHRKSASVITAPQGFYHQLIRVAQLHGQNRFKEVLAQVDQSQHRYEPAFRYFAAEAQAALILFERLDQALTVPQTADTNTAEKIICVTHASVPDQTGGYAIRAHGILKSLHDHGVNITAVTRPGFPAGTLTKASTVVIDDVPYQRLPATPVTRNHGEIQYLVSFIEPFKQLFQEQQITKVHVRSTFLIALPALIAARELGLPILYEVSGLWELVYQDREQASHLLKRSAFAELAETLTMTNANQLVVMNEAVRQIAIDRNVQEHNIHVAHNAVDVENFTPLDPPDQDVFTIGYLGSFQDYEGLDDIIDAAKLLLAQNIPLHVLMVGDGLQYNPVRSRIAREGLEEYFTLTGRVPHEQVIEQYRRMNVLVYPRRSTGATRTITPLKPFEALALAKPIIVSDVPPLQEIVGHNERGIAFQHGNVKAFGQAILQVYNDRQYAAKLGSAGRQWVVKHRNWTKVVETFVQAYRQLDA